MNTVAITVTYNDSTSSTITTNLQTASYTDSDCQGSTTGLTNPQVSNNRSAQSDLPFDFFLLKNACSKRSPTIVDTDGAVRWVGPAATKAGNNASILNPGNNSIYESTGVSSIQGIRLQDQSITCSADLSQFRNPEGQAIGATNAHNIDLARNNNMIVEVDTLAEFEANAVEFDTNCNAKQIWDLAAITNNALAGNGNANTGFVPTPPSNPSTQVKDDWFHMNATAYWHYNGYDYLLVSSRENGVFAVTYDLPSSPKADPACKSTPGTAQLQTLCWILGDTTKQWYQVLPSYSLNLGSNNNNWAPIGQHGIQIDSAGNLLLMNDGLKSLYAPHQNSGLDRQYSFVEALQLAPLQSSATPVASFFPNPPVYSAICGSAYDFKAAHLYNFANLGPYSANFTASVGTQETTVGIIAFGAYNGSTSKQVVTITYQNPVNSNYNPNQTEQQPNTPFEPCEAGWNAQPLDLSNMIFN